MTTQPTATDLAREIDDAKRSALNAAIDRVGHPWMHAIDGDAEQFASVLAEHGFTIIAAKGLTIAGPGRVVVSAKDVEYVLHYVNDTLPQSGLYWRTRSTISERCDRLRAALSGTTEDDQ